MYIRGYLSKWYRVCTKAMFPLKSSHKEGEPKNVNAKSVQKAHKPVRVGKVSGFMQRRIGPAMEICVQSGLTMGMVPCLYQSNVSIKK